MTYWTKEQLDAELTEDESLYERGYQEAYHGRPNNIMALEYQNGFSAGLQATERVECIGCATIWDWSHSKGNRHWISVYHDTEDDHGEEIEAELIISTEQAKEVHAWLTAYLARREAEDVK
jgi:hypothetical protein